MHLIDESNIQDEINRYDNINRFFSFIYTGLSWFKGVRPEFEQRDFFFLCPTSFIEHSMDIREATWLGNIIYSDNGPKYIPPFKSYAAFYVGNTLVNIRVFKDKYTYSHKGVMRMARRFIFKYRKDRLKNWVSCSCGNPLSDTQASEAHNVVKVNGCNRHSYYCPYCGKTNYWNYDYAMVPLRVNEHNELLVKNHA